MGQSSTANTSVTVHSREGESYDIGPVRRARMVVIKNALTIGTGGKLPEGVDQEKARLKAAALTTALAESV